MHSPTKNTAGQKKSEGINRRLFIERFVLALGIYPVGVHLLGSSALGAIPAQSGSGNIESADVKYPGDGATLPGYLSPPRRGRGRFPESSSFTRILVWRNNSKTFRANWRPRVTRLWP